MRIAVKWEYKQESGHWIKSGWYEITYIQDFSNVFLLSGFSGTNVYSFIHQKFEDDRIIQETINKKLDFSLYHVDFEDSYYLSDFIDNNCQSKSEYEVTTIDFFYNSEKLLTKKKITNPYWEIDFVKYFYSDGKLSQEIYSNYNDNQFESYNLLRDLVLEHDGIPDFKFEYTYDKNSVVRSLYRAFPNDIFKELTDMYDIYEKDRYLINDSFLLFDKKKALNELHIRFLENVRKQISDPHYLYSEKKIDPEIKKPVSINDYLVRILEERDDEKNIIYKFKYYD